MKKKNKVKGLKWILIKFRECKLYFSQNNKFLMELDKKKSEFNKFETYKIQLNKSKIK